MAEDLTKEILPIAEEQKQEKKLLYKNWKIYATALGIITVGLAVGLGVGLGVQNSSHNTVSTEQKIVNEINNTTTTYTLTTNINATAVSITNQITGDFIKTKLTDNNATAFNVESFKFNSITVGEDNHVLVDSDLTTYGTINAKINYSYATITNQVTNLTMPIKNYQQVVNAINNATYEIKTIIAGDTAKSVTDKITDTFIKASLSDELKNTFESNSFKLNSITVGEDNHVLTDNDFNDYTISTFAAKVNYNYGSVENQTFNLTLKVNASDQQVVNAINATSYTISNYVGDTTTNVTNKIIGDFIQTQLSNDIKNEFSSSSFIFKTVTIQNGENETTRELQDTDLTTTGTITAKINYEYGSSKEKLQGATDLTITIIVVDDEAVANYLTNNATFKIEPELASEVTSVNEQITSDFFKNNLNKTSTGIANAFNTDAFTFKAIQVAEKDEEGTVTGYHDLAYTDLNKIGLFDAKINYTYDSNDLSSKLEINVPLSLPIDISKLINENNKTLILDVTIGASDADIQNAIINALIPIVRYTIGEELWNSIGGSVISGAITDNTIITISEDHNSATIAAKSGGLFITGTVEAILLFVTN